MYKHHFIALLGLAAACGTTQAAVISGPIAHPSNGSTYYLLEETTGPLAQLEAVSLGGNLATINDAAENAFVFAAFGGGTHLIGLNDAAVEGTYVWTSGEPANYINWGPGEPNNLGNEDYVQFRTDGLWNDVPASARIKAVVEVTRTNGVPEGGAGLAMLALTLGGLTALKRRMG